MSESVRPRQAFHAYSYKHSSLLQKFVNYGRKKLYNIGPRAFWPFYARAALTFVQVKF